MKTIEKIQAYMGPDRIIKRVVNTSDGKYSVTYTGPVRDAGKFDESKHKRVGGKFSSSASASKPTGQQKRAASNAASRENKDPDMRTNKAMADTAHKHIADGREQAARDVRDTMYAQLKQLKAMGTAPDLEKNVKGHLDGIDAALDKLTA